MSPDRPVLHILFTLDCPPASPRERPYAPSGWDGGARSIDAFCTALLDAGIPPTLFVSPDAAEQHTPMFEDLGAAGVEIGLLVDPRGLHGARMTRPLGAYDALQQEWAMDLSLRRVAEALGRRPLSVRSAFYSANNETFGVMSHLGFRQASTSSPGRKLPKHAADWEGAYADAHFASQSDRLSPGTLPLLELPVTTDAAQQRGGFAPDLAVENGTVERWHAPLIEAHLERQRRQSVAFRTLCYVTSSGMPYHDRTARVRQTLDELTRHLETLEEHFDLVPTTLSGAYTRFGSSPTTAAGTAAPYGSIPVSRQAIHG